jgi:hypothetical protein
MLRASFELTTRIRACIHAESRLDAPGKARHDMCWVDTSSSRKGGEADEEAKEGRCFV